MEFKDFTELSSYIKLKELASRPYDLTGENALSPDRITKYTASAGGFDFLYATQRLDDKVLGALQLLADEAELVDKFVAMKTGQVMNRMEGHASEERQVLHTACRDIFSSTPFSLEATSQAKEQLTRLREFLEELEQGKIVNHLGESFTTIVQVGIGGSDLGPRALYLALKGYQVAGRSAQFIANVDPDDTAEVLSRVDLSRTLFNVVSKSGTTLETLTNERMVRAALEEVGLDPSRHLIAVTGVGSPMDDPANYLRSFHMFDYIGGRYSVTSMVGGITLGFALGYDAFVEVLQGAHAIDVAAEKKDIRENVPLLMAMIGIWNRNFLGHDTVAILPYSQALLRFPAHLQQCDMESNGKSVTRKGEPLSWDSGPIIWGEPGTNGQHAFYQLLHQGTTVVPAEFIGFRQNQYGRDIEVNSTTSQQKLIANMLAQSLALAKGQQNDNPNKMFGGNRPSSVLVGDRLTPFAMGALLSLYETKIAFQGYCWNINSFDQEGVQLGKILANRVLRLMEANSGKNDQSLDKNSPEFVLLDTAGCLNNPSENE